MSLAKRTVLGAIWTTAFSIGSRMIGIVTTFILTRFLPPDVQGEVYNTFIVVSSASTLANLGLGQYITANPKAGRQVGFHVTVFYVIGGIVAFGGCWLLRDVLGVALKLPSIAVYMPGFLLSVSLDRFASLPRNLLARDMRFKELGIRQALGEVTFGAVTIGTAWIGWGGQSIVAGNVARGLLGFILLAAWADRRDWLLPCRLEKETTKKLFRFGIPISIGQFFHYGAGNWDNLTMGQLFGDTTVGLYGQAYKLADLPATHIGEQIGDVLVPSFAHMDDAEGRKRALARASGLLCLVVFPLAVGLGVVAQTLVSAFYTAAWAGVAPLLTVLSVLSIVRPIGWLVGSYLQVVARTRAIMWLEILKVVLIIGSMVALSPFGPLAAAAGVGIGYGLNALFYLWSLRSEGIGFGSVVKPLFGPLLACGPMVLAVLGVRFLLQPTHVPYAIRTLIEVVVGAVAYVPSALVLARAQARDFVGLLQRTLRRGRAPQS